MKLPPDIVETYLYYDGPMLFLAQDGEHKYLWVCVDEIDGANVYLVSCLDDTSVEGVTKNKIPLIDCFDGTLSSTLYIATWGSDMNIRRITLSDIDEQWLPTPGVMLRP